MDNAACNPIFQSNESCGANGECQSKCNPACANGQTCGATGVCENVCNPACTDGFKCAANGTCVSACNPACYAGERCGSDGVCYPIAGAAPQSPPVLPWHRSPPTRARVEEQPAAPYPEQAFDDEQADAEPPPVLWANRIWGELMTFGNSQDYGPYIGKSAIGSVALAARARLYVAQHFLIQAGLPLTTVFEKRGDAIRLANPSGSLSYVFELGPRTRVFAGVGLTLPFAHLPSLPDHPRDQAEYDDAVTARVSASDAYFVARAMHGSWQPWEYYADRFSLYIPAEIETGSERLRIAAEMNLGRAFYLGSISGQHGITPFGLGARIQGYTSSNVSMGARLHMAFVLSSTPDHLQTSLEPFLEFVAGSYLMGFGFLLNLDNPAGPSSDLFVWALRLNMGSQF